MDLKTQAIVLRRTNYGEADRIVQFLTPEGKQGAMAKGVRKENSKLAGGIELFSLSEVLLKKGKGDLKILASVRLLEFWGNILKDLTAINLAGRILKEVNRVAEQVDAPEFFEISVQALRALNKIVIQENELKSSKIETVKVWWELNLAKASGVDVNLSLDVNGEKLSATKKYVWSSADEALAEQAAGEIGAEQIKLLRLMLACPIEMVLKVKGVEDLVFAVGYVAKCVAKRIE